MPPGGVLVPAGPRKWVARCARAGWARPGRTAQRGQVPVEPVVAFLPHPPVAANPVCRDAEAPVLQLARPGLGGPRARDEPGPLQDLQVLADRLLGHSERLGDLGHGGRTERQPLQDGPSRRVGQRRKRKAQILPRHRHNTRHSTTFQLDNCKVAYRAAHDHVKP